MAKYTSSQVAFILLNGINLLGPVTEIGDAGVEDMVEQTHGLGTSWEVNEGVGLGKTSLTQNGFFDDAIGGIHETLMAAQGIQSTFSYALGNTVGAPTVNWQAVMQTKYTRLVALGKFHRANATYEGSGAQELGHVLGTLTQRSTASGNTDASSFDGGALNTDGASVYAQVTELTGFTALTLKARHSADNVTFADLAATPALTFVAPGGMRARFEGTVNRYTSMSWAATGAGTFTAMVTIARGKQ